MQAFATRKQLNDVMVTLEAANIPFVLLKGAARLFRNDIEADWNLMCDIDILVPEGEGVGIVCNLPTVLDQGSLDIIMIKILSGHASYLKQGLTPQ